MGTARGKVWGNLFVVDHKSPGDCEINSKYAGWNAFPIKQYQHYLGGLYGNLIILGI